MAATPLGARGLIRADPSTGPDPFARFMVDSVAREGAEGVAGLFWLLAGHTKHPTRLPVPSRPLG
jgi:hypothetical protein